MHMRNEHLPPTLPPTLTPFTQEYVWCGQDEPATRPPHAGRVYQLGDKAGLYTGIVLGSGSVSLSRRRSHASETDRCDFVTDSLHSVSNWEILRFRSG
jgi:hypothetical protein